MPNRIYALLAGINAYPSQVGKLAGCLNDVSHFRDYLTGSFANPAVEVLQDGEATRENVIKLFRSHLGKAAEGDVALFQYCGHGARWASAKEFLEFYPDGKDEGLVCVDSRLPGGFDLADKELAILISEVAKKNPHVAIVLDCCHSGSATRGVDAFSGLIPRVTHEVTAERPLESYLDGYYATLRKQNQPLSIPAGRHILLAACERTQLAQESPDESGVFTSTLVEVLNQSAGDVTYPDLFVKCRTAVRKRAQNQNPQFEAYGAFNAWSGFLGRAASRAVRRFSVIFDQGKWKADCGAITGLPTDKTATLALYPEKDPAHLAGTAATVQVGAQRSVLKLDFPGDEAACYRAEITSLPVPPLPIFFKKDGASTGLREALEQGLKSDGSVAATLTGIEEGARYGLSVEGGGLLLKQRETDLSIQGVEVNPSQPQDAASLMLPILKHLSQWERSLGLQNRGTKMDLSRVDFIYAEQLDNGQEHVYSTREVILDYVRDGDRWKDIRGKLKARNRSRQTLHMMLAYFSSKYGVRILKNDPIEPGDAWVTLWGDQPNQYFFLPDAANCSLDRFKLIVSTEKVDDFLLAQKPLDLGKIIPATRDIGDDSDLEREVAHRDEWFTRDIRIQVLRRLDHVGAANATLAQGKILVYCHPALTANLSMSPAKSASREVGDGSDFYKAFERQGMELLNFSGGRGGDDSVLELTDIQNAASLKDTPLEIQLNVPLEDGEAILPFVYDGEHVVLGGDPYKDDDGNTHILIDHIPEVADTRRGLGESLKLYFLKTYLKQDNLNQLRWVDYKPDGSFEYRKDMVAGKVAAAENILLLIHGIIGDTEAMAKGVRACGLDGKFDLVLTYDYENLNTPIEETAQELKSQLAAAGLGENDNKRLTILAHSMGGLVSRWFIEREGGNQVVDHLVMCGTPNHGSPFGEIDKARSILRVLTSLSMTYLHALVPFNSAMLMLLNRSKKLTPTLEQMNPASHFIKTLNNSADPGIPYTILAGDVDAYQEPSDRLFAKMLAKAGQSFLFEALFSRQPNDIAVGVESILGDEGTRAMPPVRRNVACHHLNYFASQAGQEALTKQVEWNLALGKAV